MDYKPSKNQVIIDEFIDSGWDCARVCDWTNKTASNCASSINISIKRYRKSGIKAIQRGEDVFLVRV